jgi:transcriptional regulator with XRE-family HTH domain
MFSFCSISGRTAVGEPSLSQRPESPGSEWGRGIQLACLRLGLSRGELAARSGISRTTLYQIERGTVAHPRANTLKRIADALEIDVARFSELDEPVANGRSDAREQRVFDRATNTSINDVYEESPSLFGGWSAAEWDELYSTFGQGGQLTPDGVVQSAVHINRKREVAHRLNVLLETHLGDVAAGLIDTLYKLVSPTGNGVATRDGKPAD